VAPTVPSRLAFKIRRLNRWGDLVVAENLISYDGAPPMYTVNLIELNTDGKITHERIYIMESGELQTRRDETPA
jgi:hypothetical protein